MLDCIFFKKITSNCSSGQIGCSFVNQAESISNVWRFFRKFWKPFWWKNSCLEKKHPEKLLRMQFLQSRRKFSEKIWNRPDQTRTPRLQIRKPVDIFSVTIWWSSRSIKKREILKFSQNRPFFAQYPEWTFLKLSILSHCFLGDVECSLRTFLRVFAQIPKLVMSLDYISKKRKWYSGKTECSSKKMEVTLSRIK